MEYQDKNKKTVAIEHLLSRDVHTAIDWLMKNTISMHSLQIENFRLEETNRRPDVCRFRYNKKSYKLTEKESPLVDFNGDYINMGKFKLVFKGKLVFKTTTLGKDDEYERNISLSYSSVKKITLDSWIDEIPELVSEAKRQFREINQSAKVKRKEREVDTIDKNFDLGDFGKD